MYARMHAQLHTIHVLEYSRIDIMRPFTHAMRAAARGRGAAAAGAAARGRGGGDDHHRRNYF